MRNRTKVFRRFYAVCGRDRHKLLFAEVGHAERVVTCDDGVKIPLCNGLSPSLRVTLGWPVPGSFTRDRQHVELALGRVWVEINLPEIVLAGVQDRMTPA